MRSSGIFTGKADKAKTSASFSRASFLSGGQVALQHCGIGQL